jgi:hypothetical protein
MKSFEKYPAKTEFNSWSVSKKDNNLSNKKYLLDGTPSFSFLYVMSSSYVVGAVERVYLSISSSSIRFYASIRTISS